MPEQPRLTPSLTPEAISAIDAAHIWHPYSTIGAPGTLPPVVALAAEGAWLTWPVTAVRSGSSTRWRRGGPQCTATATPRWMPRLTRQLSVMNHVMFGGLTHEPAARLAQLLVEITPDGPRHRVLQ